MGVGPVPFPSLFDNYNLQHYSGLQCGADSLKIGLAVPTQCDRETDRQTSCHVIYRAMNVRRAAINRVH